YHHFGGKEQILAVLIDHYWQELTDPELPLNKVFAANRFPDDLEELAAAIEQVVDRNSHSILLIYIDVIEFKGKHIHEFYRRMAERFSATYEDNLKERQERGELGEPSPLFGVPMHLGLDSKTAVAEFCRILRLGLLPRFDTPRSASPARAPKSLRLKKGDES